MTNAEQILFRLAQRSPANPCEFCAKEGEMSAHPSDCIWAEARDYFRYDALSMGAADRRDSRPKKTRETILSAMNLPSNTAAGLVRVMVAGYERGFGGQTR